MKPHPLFAACYARLDRAAQRGWLGERRRGLVADAAGTVLEIGAGHGANLPHYRAAQDLVLTEPDPAMRARVDPRLARVRFELLDAAADALPMPDASVDVVVSAFVLCTVGDVPAVLSEVRRVLRPGGELRFLEHVRPDGRAGVLADRIAPGWRRVAAGCSPNRRTVEALEAAGLRVAECEAFVPPVPVARALMPMVQGRARS